MMGKKQHNLQHKETLIKKIFPCVLLYSIQELYKLSCASGCCLDRSLSMVFALTALFAEGENYCLKLPLYKK
jgi:hypothetical protein